MRLLLLLLLAALCPLTLQARVISAEERWQGEIRVTEPIRVEAGGRLVIAPGSRVIASAAIEVSGVLMADNVEFSGEDWPGLVLKRVGDETRLSNCRISGARTGISVIGGAPSLERLRLEKNRVGIELRQQTRARVIDSIFRDNGRVGLFLKDEAAALVRGNLFQRQGKFGVYIYRALPQQFSANRFVDNPIGLMISHFGSNPLIDGNQFLHNVTGIKVDRTAKPRIETNLLRDNQTAIELYRRSDPLIRHNRLERNQRAIHISFSSYPRIRQNDFVDNRRALVLEFQSTAWEKDKGSAARQEQVAAQGAFGGQKQNRVTEEQRRAQNLDGSVDARDNWWGAEETRQLADLDADANLAWIDDGLDTPTFEEGGRIYPLDRVRWHPYSTQPQALLEVK